MMIKCVLAAALSLAACGGNAFVVERSAADAGDASSWAPDDSSWSSMQTGCDACSQAEHDSSRPTDALERGDASIGTDATGAADAPAVWLADSEAGADVEQLEAAAADVVDAQGEHEAAAPVPCTNAGQCALKCPPPASGPCCSSAHVCACPTLALVCP